MSSIEPIRERYLKGAIDLHLHAGPDVRRRKLTYLEAAIQGKEVGMKAILILDSLKIHIL